MRASAGVGRLCFWNGASLWIGRDAGPATLHSHHAIQVTLALEGSFQLRDAADAAWARFTGALVPPHRRHQFDGCGATIAQLFVEPETATGRASLQRFGAGHIEALPPDTRDAMAALLRDAYRAAASDDELIAASERAIALLSGPVAHGKGIDARIARVIASLQARLPASITLGEAAAIAHLSPSRFRHLFIEQTGMAFRAFVLWQRLNVAIRAAMHGASWTDAAHGAGFSDSSHLSRTFRRMFGVVPAMLVMER